MNSAVHISESDKKEILAMLQQAGSMIKFVYDKLGYDPGSELRMYAEDTALFARPSTNVKGLKSKIVNLLKQAKRPLRSVDICDALYHPSMGISRDRFGRRVIVTVSALNKKGNSGIVKLDTEGKDALWVYVDSDGEPTGLDYEYAKGELMSVLIPSKIGATTPK